MPLRCVRPLSSSVALLAAALGCGSDIYGPRSSRVVGTWELEQSFSGSVEGRLVSCIEDGAVTFGRQDGRVVSGGYAIRRSVCPEGGPLSGRVGSGPIAEGSASATAIRFRMAGCDYEGTLSYVGNDQGALVNFGEGVFACDSTVLQGFSGTWTMTR